MPCARLAVFHRIGVCSLALVLVLASSTAWGQDKKKAAEEKVPPPKPVDGVVTTDDYVDLHYTFYPSLEGKKAVPVILVHGWEGRRTELDPLARFLQEAGHAVMVPDLRGHGASTVRKIAGQPAIDLKPADLKPADLAMMATSDFIALKKELLTRNNAGELNIKLLTIVGIDVGSIVALNWAAIDYSRIELPTITIGRDVKALVLVSPVQNYKTLKPNAALSNQWVIKALSIMIIGGANDAKTNTEMKRLQNTIGRFHPAPKKLATESDEEFIKRTREEKNFYDEFEDTTLQGVKLINAPRPLNVATKIAAFIKLRIVDKADSKDLPAWEGERRTKEPLN